MLPLQRFGVTSHQKYMFLWKVLLSSLYICKYQLKMDVERHLFGNKPVISSLFFTCKDSLQFLNTFFWQGKIMVYTIVNSEYEVWLRKMLAWG